MGGEKLAYVRQLRDVRKKKKEKEEGKTKQKIWRMKNEKKKI